MVGNARYDHCNVWGSHYNIIIWRNRSLGMIQTSFLLFLWTKFNCIYEEFHRMLRFDVKWLMEPTVDQLTLLSFTKWFSNVSLASKLIFLAPESAWKAACHSTKMLLLGIDPKIYCKLEKFCLILSMFWNIEFTRKIQSFMTPTFQFKQWFTKCIKSTMFNFLAFYSLEYTRSDDTKFMILLSYQSGVTSIDI